LFATPAYAQLPDANKAGLNAAVLKLFSDVGGFTSKAEVRLQEKGSADALTMTAGFTMVEGKVRMDLDMATLQSKQMPPETLAGFKAVGLDKFATVLRPDRKATLLIYPAVQCYVEMPMSPEDAADVDRRFKIEKTRLGRETIGGHSCEKNRVVVAADSGGKHEATVWHATALKDFPLKVQMEQPEMTVIMEFRDVKLVRPDARQFEAPAGYAKHGSMEQLMQSAMLKTLGGQK
jgi:hypothetical protein